MPINQAKNLTPSQAILNGTSILNFFSLSHLKYLLELLMGWRENTFWLGDYGKLFEKERKKDYLALRKYYDNVNHPVYEIAPPCQT